MSAGTELTVQEGGATMLGVLDREVLTPEGVAVKLKITPFLTRAVAFGLDLTLVLIASTILAVVGLLATPGEGGGWFGSLMIVSLFVVRHFYFMGFELRWRGQTPGKKLCRLRVIDARGGVLTPGALVVRNVTRDVEMFLPLALLVGAEQFWGDSPAVVIVLCLGWTLLFMAMPFLNRDRMRVGDLAAGTIVIEEPRVTLFEEVTAQARLGDRRVARHGFSNDQLDMYGIYELQVLEDFLRQYPGEGELMLVAEKITRKIAWKGTIVEGQTRQFLEDFYDALRARREQRLLLGDRQESKKEGVLEGGA